MLRLFWNIRIFVQNLYDLFSLKIYLHKSIFKKNYINKKITEKIQFHKQTETDQVEFETLENIEKLK